MLQNYKFTIAYDGSRFFGWERQPDRETIQGKLESLLSRLALPENVVLRYTEQNGCAVTAAITL